MIGKSHLHGVSVDRSAVDSFSWNFSVDGGRHTFLSSPNLHRHVALFKSFKLFSCMIAVADLIVSENNCLKEGAGYLLFVWWNWRNASSTQRARPAKCGYFMVLHFKGSLTAAPSFPYRPFLFSCCPVVSFILSFADYNDHNSSFHKLGYFGRQISQNCSSLCLVVMLLWLCPVRINVFFRGRQSNVCIETAFFCSRASNHLCDTVMSKRKVVALMLPSLIMLGPLLVKEMQQLHALYKKPWTNSSLMRRQKMCLT